MSNTDLARLARTFNSLPRRPLLPSGHGPNKWVFGLHLVPLPPPGNLLSIMNPLSRYAHCEGPLPLDFPLNTNLRPDPKHIQERAQQIAILLVKAFVEGLGQGSDVPPHMRFAPWEWAIEDVNPVWASAVGAALRQMGVRSELCVVGVASAEERKVAVETFQELLKLMIKAARAAGAVQK